MIKQISVIALLLIIAALSCKKPGGSTPVSTAIIGSWAYSKVYIDTNLNGIMDANEMFSDTSFPHQVLKYNSDGTVIGTYYGAPWSKGTWELTNNNTYIKTTDTAAGAIPSYAQIISISSTSFEVKDTATTGGHHVEWVFLTKQ